MRRRRYNFKIGIRKHDYLGNALPYGWHVANACDILKELGFKAKVKACSLSGFTRFAVDEGYMSSETLDSLAGHIYGQLATIQVYAYPKDEEKVKIILRGCFCDILENHSSLSRLDV